MSLLIPLIPFIFYLIECFIYIDVDSKSYWKDGTNTEAKKKVIEEK